MLDSITRAPPDVFTRAGNPRVRLESETVRDVDLATIQNRDIVVVSDLQSVKGRSELLELE